MRTTRFRRASRVRREKIWACIQTDQTALTIAVQAADLVTAADWSGVGGFERGATLERIRGCYSLSIGGGANNNPIIDLALVVINAGESVPDPGDVNTYVLEDVLWQRRHEMRTTFGTAVGVETHSPYEFEIDVKSRRKLDTNKQVEFIFTTSSITQAPVITSRLRALISKP